MSGGLAAVLLAEGMGSPAAGGIVGHTQNHHPTNPDKGQGSEAYPSAIRASRVSSRTHPVGLGTLWAGCKQAVWADPKIERRDDLQLQGGSCSTGAGQCQTLRLFNKAHSSRQLSCTCSPPLGDPVKPPTLALTLTIGLTAASRIVALLRPLCRLVDS